MAVRHYRAMLEPTETGYSVFFPEVPGCVSAGDDAEDAVRNAGEALALHIEGMIEDGLGLPVSARLDAPLPEWLIEVEAGVPANELYRVLIPVDLPGKAVRVNLSMDEGLVARVDSAAAAQGMTRSAFLAKSAKRMLADA
jgi:predicted RNase H-like HicB family nuclease